MLYDELLADRNYEIDLTGQPPREYSQLLLAEDLPLEALARNLTLDVTADSPRSLVGQSGWRAWAELEMGLSRSISLESATVHLDDADSYAARALEESRCRFGNLYHSARLRAYWSRFDARRHDVVLDDATEETILDNLCTIYDDIGSAPIHPKQVDDYDRHFMESDHAQCFADESEKFGTQIKLATDLLLARAGYDIYPTSERERQTSRGNPSPEAHDGYLIEDGAKITYRVRFGGEKTRHHRDVNVFINFSKLLTGAFRDVGLLRKDRTVSSPQVQGLANDVTAALVAEARNEPIKSSMEEGIEHMTEALAAKMEAA